MIDKKELRRLAEAAPRGPWFGPEYDPCTEYVFDADLGSLLHYESIDTEQDQCLRYVAAANPAAIIMLLDELERFRKDAERWQCVRNAIPMQSPYAVWREGSHLVLGKDADELVDNFLMVKGAGRNV